MMMIYNLSLPGIISLCSAAHWVKKGSHPGVTLCNRQQEQVISYQPEKENSTLEEVSISSGQEELLDKENNSLNSSYTIENIIVGPSNRLAHAACKAVIENRYNL